MSRNKNRYKNQENIDKKIQEEQKSTPGLMIGAGEITQVNDYDKTSYSNLMQDYSDMSKGDPIISAVLNVLKKPIETATLKMEPGKNDKGEVNSTKAQEASDYIKWQFDNIDKGFQYFKRHCLLMLDNGAMFFEMIPLRGYDYKGKTTNIIAKFSPIQYHTINKFYYDDAGEFIGIEHNKYVPEKAIIPIDIMKENLFYCVHNMTFGDVRGNAILRPGRITYKAKNRILDSTVRMGERGAGIPVFSVTDQKDDTKNKTLKANVEKMAKTVGNHPAAYVIEEENIMKFRLEGLKNTENNMQLLEYFDRQLFFMTLTEFLSSGIAGNGSRAATSEHKTPFEQNIAGILNELKEYLQELVYEMIDMSYFGVMDDNDYPIVNFESLNQADLSIMADNLVKLAQSRGITITEEDEIFIRKQFGMPTIDVNRIKQNRENNKQQTLIPEIPEDEKKKSGIEQKKMERHVHADYELENIPVEKMTVRDLWRQPSRNEQEIFELESAINTINDVNINCRRELEDVYLKYIKDIAVQLSKDNTREPDTRYRGELLSKMNVYLDKCYNTGCQDIRKEIIKQGGKHKERELIKLSKDENINKRLSRKIDYLLTSTKNAIMNEVERLGADYIDKRKGGIDKYIIEEFELAQKRQKNDIMNFIIGGYNGGRNSEIDINKDIIEELEYSAILDEALCDVCGPYDGLRMSYDEAVNNGFNIIINIKKQGIALNPECRGKENCRCVFIIVGVKPEEAGKISDYVYGVVEAPKKAIKTKEVKNIIDEIEDEGIKETIKKKKEK